ncbi:hypothetical protein ACO2Q1_16230 [Brevundimonas sp. VNH65]|uniref:hypothetical protein n=1 Tax=Brevundimonas sp. VNH65 TaxID=3400917 RepID=UPI003C04B978
MQSSSPPSWSMFRSLAFLAATFALTLGALLPSAVAASPALGAPVVLCSGDQVSVVYDDAGRPHPVEHSDLASLTCASALLSALAAVDVTPPEVPVRTIPPIPAFRPSGQTPPPAVRRPAPRPPSTAPPAS